MPIGTVMRRFLGNVPVRGKLSALVVMPLISVLVFAWLCTGERLAALDAANDTAVAVQVISAADELTLALYAEQLVIDALGRAEGLEVDPSVLRDMQVQVEVAQRASDAAAAALGSTGAALLDPDGRLLRAGPDGTLARPEGPAALATAIERQVQVLATTVADPASAIPLVSLSRLRAFVLLEQNLHSWSVDDAPAFSEEVGLGGASQPAIYRSALQQTASLHLPDDLAGRLVSASEHFEPALAASWSPLSAGRAPTADEVDTARGTFRDYFAELGRIEDEAVARVISAKDDNVASAKANVRTTVVVVVAVVLGTAVLCALVARSIIKPLRRMVVLARRYADGAIDVERLDVRGCDEIAVATAAIDDGFALRRQLGDTVKAMARHDLDAAVLNERLPGELGDVLDDAVATLRTLAGRLRESEELSRAIVQHAGEAIWLVDEQGLVVQANRAAGELLGCNPGEQTGLPWAQVLPRADGARQCPPPATDASVEVSLQRVDGTLVPVLLSCTPVVIGPTRLTVVLAHDISDRKGFEERLLVQATRDELTGLPNRADLRAQLERACRLSGAGRGFGVLFFDLDRFKQVNDSLGHDAGDRLLVQVAARLRDIAGPADTVARLGGDEFVVLAEGLDGEVALGRLADRLVRAFAEPFALGDIEVWATASVGQVWTTGEADPGEVLRRADTAMYRAKSVGRNRVEVFDRRIQEVVEQRAAIERQLRRGLASGEIVAHLQPVVELATERIVGAELLARWQRPDGTTVSPAEFVPVAEESGLVVDLGRVMLRQACELLAARAERGAVPVQLNVNISGRHVLGGDLIGDVTSVLAATGAPAELLTIELTESHLIEDAAEAIRRLEMLRSLGVGLAIDDFGTGYSSMGYLQQLPVDTVKVDKSFVDGLGVDPRRTAIVQATVSLGATFGLKVVAEGVETAAQAAHLRSLGCGYGQGWLFGKPVPAPVFELLVDLAAPAPLRAAASI